MKKEIQLEEVKKIQINILDYIVKICEKNSLQYFLGGGTLLGAVRHKGFIPWDNDIDIMMPRKDYMKLINLMKQPNNNDNVMLLSNYYNPNYYYPFAKAVDVRTEEIEINRPPIENYGIYIDIFPIDNLPNDEEERKKIFYKINILQHKLYMLQYDKIIADSKIKYLLKLIAFQFIKRKSCSYYINKIEKICRKYEGQVTNYKAAIIGLYAEKEVMKSEEMDKTVLVDFEGKKYCAPIGYHEYLTKHYGDYMKLPPKEKQKLPHDNKAYWKGE